MPALGAAACLSCNLSSVVNGFATLRVGSINVSECTCELGFERLLFACVACAHGSFKVVVGNHQCTM